MILLLKFMIIIIFGLITGKKHYATFIRLIRLANNINGIKDDQKWGKRDYY
jgi:hypothetical protein